ncbi:MAG: metallopeptidase TldD-related protein [Rhodoferax sp.]|uniref:TldD/PmbA family protein n=2 Tax=Rhodoferax sp. TaxID=50421 RepID=UPI003264CEA8
MQSYFQQLAAAVCTPIAGADRVTLYFSAESSDFIRFNHAQVRQATHVDQRYGTVSVVAGQKRASSSISLGGDLAADTADLLAERTALLAQLPLVPDDAYLLQPDAVVHTERSATGTLPTPAQLIAAVAEHAAGTDLVGFYAAGSVVRAFADSRGQRNWHSVESFHFDWCLYREKDQAVKCSYAGTDWHTPEFARRVQEARTRLALLALPPKTLAPGAYRVYFSPVAVAELLGTLAWGGFGLKDLKTGTSTLLLAHQGKAALSPLLTLTEATAEGIAPRFQSDGFTKPDAVALVRAGQMAASLTAPRSAVEYGMPTNGCGEGESPESLAMAAGPLPEAEVLQTLGTGVFISNLHYLNYSDRQACRMTGMTRFACFWVEDGKIVAPIPVMRFDDSFLRMFGPGLVALTDHAELVPADGTYGARQLQSITAPGAIVEGFALTL